MQENAEEQNQKGEILKNFDMKKNQNSHDQKYLWQVGDDYVIGMGREKSLWTVQIK